MSQSMASAANTDSASDRLQALGLDLPELRDNSKYVNHRTVDSSIYISGQLPYKDGWLLGQGICRPGRRAGDGAGARASCRAQRARCRCGGGWRPGPGPDRADAGLRGQHAGVR